jgi:hypothetical protein
LVGLTVAAFFITQHLKTVTPLVLSRGYGPPGPDPAGINPNNHAHTCKNVFGQRVACNVTKLRIRLQHGSEKVEVFVVNRSGDAVDTLSSGRFLAQGNLGVFSWNGRNTSGRVVHEGTYYFRIELADGGGEELTDRPISVITKDPKPVITGVTPSVIEPGSSQATIHFRTDGYTGAQVLIYRTTARGRLTLVSSPRFLTSPSNGKAIWNGLLAGKPAPAGTYMVGLRLRDAAGNYGTTPAGTDVVPGTTPGMGVTVRYIAAEPPLTPTAAGQSATVYVDSQQHAYTWQLRAIGARKALEHGSVKANATPELHVPMPGKRAGLYELRVVAGSHRTTVPLIASAKAGSPHVLVVLPMLTWQGKNPVDEDGDGLPQTLAAGDSIRLPQPLVRGLPAGFEAEAQLLAYLKSRHVAYDLTTDVALARGAGPSLPGRRGVLLDGSFTWLPSSVASQLRGYVKGGGRVASIGLNSMQRQVKLLGSDADLHTGTASPLRPDPFGARHGAVTGTDGELVTVLSDKLGLFGDTPALQGVERYQSIVPPTRAATSLAGVAESAPAVAGFTLGSGQVVEVGIEGFVGSLAHNVDSQELMSSITKSLGGSS